MGKGFLGMVACAGVGLLFGGSGCGSSDDGGSIGSPQGGLGATGSGGSGATGGSGSGATGGSGGSGNAGAGGNGATGGGGTSGTDPYAECQAQATQQPNPACASCACDHCLTELQACEADPTCVGLRTCALQNNCCDELCVLTRCGGELQQAGGLQGAGTQKAIAVRDCTEQNQCNCCQ
jgi:hypothetical protein